MSNDTDAKNRHWELSFDVRRSIRYHMRRQGFFENWHRFTSGMAVIFGSATIAALLTSIDSHMALWTASTVTILSSVDLIIGTSQRAWLHADLRRQLINLEKELVGKEELDIDKYTNLYKQLLNIEVEEPPILRALDIICHNEEMRSEGIKEDSPDYLPLPWYQRWSAQFISWNIGQPSKKASWPASQNKLIQSS